MYLKLFRVTAGNVHSFRIRSKETLRMCPKYPVLDNDPKNPPPLWIIWIHDLLLDLTKETKYPFRIENPDLDLSKEITHP